VNRQWLDRALQARGISQYKLKTEFHISPQTFKAWENGQAVRPSTLRRLAEVMRMDYDTLRRNLGVVVLTTARIRRLREAR
jgi:transcriptional regulator with XRE-family HTH domain